VCCFVYDDAGESDEGDEPAGDHVSVLSLLGGTEPEVTEGVVSLIWSWAVSSPDVLRKRWRSLDDQS
jgi:hypothetical protein